MRALSMIVLLSACTPSYDLEVKLDADHVAVGEAVTATVRGFVDVPAHASVEVSVFVQAGGASTEIPEVTFETLRANPSGWAEFLDGRHSADNESAAVLFTMREPDDITAKWRIVCGTPGEWEVHAAAWVQAANGAPVGVEQANERWASLTCE